MRCWSLDQAALLARISPTRWAEPPTVGTIQRGLPISEFPDVTSKRVRCRSMSWIVMSSTDVGTTVASPP